MNDKDYLHFHMDGNIADYDMHGNKAYLLAGTMDCQNRIWRK